MFLKRQWIIGKRFGFVTPGEMLSYYFRSDIIRILVIVVALVFSVPYLGVQLRASGFLFNVLTDGLLSIEVGMWVLSAVVFIYVASGGLRAVAYVDTLQCILLAAGIVIIGVIAMNAVGGWGAAAGQHRGAHPGRPEADPGRLQPLHRDPGRDPVRLGRPLGRGRRLDRHHGADLHVRADGHPVGAGVLDVGVLQPLPAPDRSRSGEPFGIGLILFLFTAMQGMGGHFLGADLSFAAANPERSRCRREQDRPDARPGRGGRRRGRHHRHALMQQSPELGDQPALLDLPTADSLVAQLINLMADTAPWMVGLLSVCALAAMQSTGAAYMSTAGGMLTRDLIRHFLMPNIDHRMQKLFGRIGVGVIVLLALIVATTTTDALVLLGGLAVAYGFQMWPALIAVCYWPWLTRQGVVLGLIAGLIVVTVTDGPSTFGIEAWGRWPWTIHSAGWGIIFNLAVALIVSAITRDDMDRKMEFHNFLAQHASLPPEKRKLIPAAWIVTIAWFFFGIGPGAVIGNWIFGSPDDPAHLDLRHAVDLGLAAPVLGARAWR